MIDLSAPATDVAPLLLGATIWHGPVAVRLTEVEAYTGLDDPASHAFRGPTPRARVMFGPPSHVYVYLSYGMHRCVNLVCSPDGVASAVLLRGGRVIAGEEDARLRRGGVPENRLACGPGIRWNSSTPTPHRRPAGGSNPRTTPSNFVKAPGWGSAEMSTPPGGGGSPRTPLFLGLGSRNPPAAYRDRGPSATPSPRSSVTMTKIPTHRGPHHWSDGTLREPGIFDTGYKRGSRTPAPPGARSAPVTIPNTKVTTTST